MNLLVLFEQMIKDRGGNEKLAYDIESEWLKIPKKPRPRRVNVEKLYKWYSDEDDVFLIQNYGVMPLRILARSLGRTIKSLYARSHMLRERGIDIKRYGQNSNKQQSQNT